MSASGSRKGTYQGEKVLMVRFSWEMEKRGWKTKTGIETKSEKNKINDEINVNSEKWRQNMRDNFRGGRELPFSDAQPHFLFSLLMHYSPLIALTIKPSYSYPSPSMLWGLFLKRFSVFLFIWQVAKS